MSPYAYDAVATLLPVGSAVVDEHISGGPCINCCKECDDKLTLVIKAADVNSITISRPCKLGALAGKRIDRRFQDIEEQTKQALSAIKAEIACDRHANVSQKAELVRNGLAIVSQQRKHLDVEAAVRVNTL